MCPPHKGFCPLDNYRHGSNGIVVPRGLFYESQLNQTLGGTYPSGSPLAKMTVQANQFAVSGPLTLDAYLNARTVQMVKLLGLVSTLASLASLGISLWTLF